MPVIIDIHPLAGGQEGKMDLKEFLGVSETP
jgi:hypothetical protein